MPKAFAVPRARVNGNEIFKELADGGGMVAVFVRYDRPDNVPGLEVHCPAQAAERDATFNGKGFIAIVKNVAITL